MNSLVYSIAMSPELRQKLQSIGSISIHTYAQDNHQIDGKFTLQPEQIEQLGSKNILADIEHRAANDNSPIELQYIDRETFLIIWELTQVFPNFPLSLRDPIKLAKVLIAIDFLMLQNIKINEMLPCIRDLSAKNYSILYHAFRDFEVNFPFITEYINQAFEGHLRWKVLQPGMEHADTVYSLASSADSKRIATGSYDKKVRIWQENRDGQWQLMCNFGYTNNGHASWVNVVAMSSDGNTVVSGSDDKTIIIWEPNIHGVWSGRKLGSFPHSSGVRSLAIASDGKKIISGDIDGSLNIYRKLQNGQYSHTLLNGHRGTVMSLSITADGHQLVSGGYDKAIKIWNIQQGTLMHTFMQLHEVYCVAMRPDGNQIVAGLSDGSIIVGHKNAQNEWIFLEPFKGHNKPVNCIAILSDGNKIVTGSRDGVIKVWQLDENNTLQLVDTITIGKNEVRSLCMPTSKELFCATGNSLIKIAQRLEDIETEVKPQNKSCTIL